MLCNDYLADNSITYMLGDRDWKSLVNKVIDEKYERLKENIEDDDKITVDECTRCLRRAYYDRKEPSRPTNRLKMKSILSNAIKFSIRKEYEVDGLTLIGYADAIIDDVLLCIIPVTQIPKEPFPEDILYINSNLYIFNVENGVLIYSDGGGNTIEFSLVRDKRLFNETIRRARILSTLLREGKVPIIEPSDACIECQYQERCYLRKWKYNESLLKIFKFTERD